MKTQLTSFGSFLIVTGAVALSLSLTTDAAIFQPIIPPLLTLLAGGLLLVVGLLLP